MQTTSRYMRLKERLLRCQIRLFVIDLCQVLPFNLCIQPDRTLLLGNSSASLWLSEQPNACTGTLISTPGEESLRLERKYRGCTTHSVDTKSTNRITTNVALSAFSSFTHVVWNSSPAGCGRCLVKPLDVILSRRLRRSSLILLRLSCGCFNW